MGLSSKKQSTQTSQTENSTSASTANSAVNVPQWLLDPAQQIAGGIGSLTSQGPDPYTPQVSDAQQAAQGAGADRLLAGGWGYGNARDAATAVPNVQAGSVLDGLSNYYTPFKDQVLNPVLDDYDHQAGITRAAQAAQGAQGAFQGSRFGVREAQTEGELARGRAATEGGLLGDMYTQATGLSAADKARQLQADQGNQQAGLQRAGLLADIANDQSGMYRQNLTLADQLGKEQTDQANAQRQYPLSFAKDMTGLFQGLDPSAFFGKTVNTTGTSSGTSNSTSNTTQSDSLLGQLGQVAQIAALFMGG